MSHAIEVDHLTKRYRLRSEGGRTLKELLLGQYPPGSEVTALTDVSFSVDHGETLGVIGANGSGKSTLLKVLAGTSRPTAGRVDVSGRVSALLEIGAGFHPDFSGRENAYLNGSLLGLSRREMDTVMLGIQEFADIGRFFDAPVKTYSSGMYSRLGFAVAIHVEPDVLLVDEVLAVGDEYFQHKCFAKINAFRAGGKTILFVSHDLAAVKRICGRALFLDAGRIAAEGDVQYVADAYEDTVRSKEGRELATATSAKRWGTHEIEITAVRLLDAGGADQRVFRSGEPVTIELSYRARRAIDEVTFGVAFYRDDGLACYGSNTTLDGVHVAVRAGEGIVRFHAPRFELLEGQYTLDVAAVSPDYADTYDFHSKAYPFRTYGASGEIGVVRIAHGWVHDRAVNS